MPFGLVLSLLCHAALIGWAVFSMRSTPPLTPDTPSISADIITPSEFLRLKQGSEDAKNLETKAKDEPKPDDSKNDTAKPSNAPPPPPPPPAEEEVAKVEPPPEPEPPKAAEPPKPEPDPVAKKVDEPPPPPPPPEPAPGPTPDEKRLLEQKLEDDRKAEEAKKAEEEAKKKADEEAKKKAEEEAKKKADEEERKKKHAEEVKKKKQEEAKKKAEAAKKKFDASKIASLLDKAPDDAPPKALLDRDPKKKGQQAAGTSQSATAVGKEAGTATGTDTVLSAREQDLLKGMLKSQLNGCWRPPGTGGGSEVPVVTLQWQMNPDGSIVGEPRVTDAPSSTAGQVYSEAALRAVKMCSPFRLPPDKYDAWKIIDWTFDPRQML